MLDIISVGDATLDVFLQMNEDDASVQCDLRKEDCQLCLTYADKIPVDSIVKIPGAGNGSNNAVGSSRLGMNASMLSIVGDDDVGRNIIARWKKEGVDTKYVSLDKKRGTNYSTVLNYRGERTILVFHEKRDYTFPKTLPKAEWLYYTSLGKGSEKMHPALLTYIKKNEGEVVFPTRDAPTETRFQSTKTVSRRIDHHCREQRRGGTDRRRLYKRDEGAAYAAEVARLRHRRDHRWPAWIVHL